MTFATRQFEQRSTTSGFTLAEMIVAIGAVALLTIGIGQIFQSTGDLVGTGAAIAETDQMARALEAQLREDFDSLNRMRAEETFLLIRNRRIRDVYLSSLARDSDRRAGILPSDSDSLAVTTRLDEICFLGVGGGNDGLHRTAQIADPIPGFTSPRSSVAMIYYGHGLRPALEASFDPDNPGLSANVPERQWTPDGDFGQRRADPRGNRFDDTVEVQGRNEFAGDWILLRQAVLLLPEIAGPPPGVTSGAGFDAALTYAPLIRPRETDLRKLAWNGIADDDDVNWPGNASGPYVDRPKPRYLPFGRTDICAQDPEGVQRWLEGYPVPPTGVVNPPPFDATPFTAGSRFDVRSVSRNPSMLGTFDNDPDAILWERPGLNLASNPLPGQVIGANVEILRRYQSALAGILTRRMAESGPPLIDRRDTLTVGAGSTGGNLPKGEDPSTALMDLHATLGSQCSSFEVAWSDGTTWPLDEAPYGRDMDGDGVDDIIYEPGDIVWFDIEFPRHEPTSPDVDSFERSVRTIVVPPPDLTHPEITWEARRNRLYVGGERGAYARVGYGDRDALMTGAVPDDDPQSEEYLAIWGYRRLLTNGSGEFTNSAWIKPRLIRIRVTLHDDQLRLADGRTYEFVFGIDQPG